MTRDSISLVHLIAATAALFAVGLLSSSAEAASDTHQLTIYARATQAQFVNHSDDRSRAIDANPFNADTKSLIPLTKKKEQGNGPFPGDNALYSFKLFSDAGLKKSVGSAVYSCTYNFSHQAICDANFQLNGGAMFASGPADFDATSFTLAVTGGTNKYFGARGQVSAGPASKDAHRLSFLLR